MEVIDAKSVPSVPYVGTRANEWTQIMSYGHESKVKQSVHTCRGSMRDTTVSTNIGS